MTAARIRPGDVILGLPSLGLHTNGYSLARKVLLEQEGLQLTEHIPELGRTLGRRIARPASLLLAGRSAAAGARLAERFGAYYRRRHYR